MLNNTDIRTAAKSSNVRLWELAERLHISVIDNGTGISAEALEKIQRFVQKREYQKDLGVGIQNAIDRMDLLYHGKGSVQVSKNEPRGTRVDIMMPIQRKELSDDECDFD